LERSWNDSPKTGPLAGIRIIEMPAVGPVPFAGMLLAEMGAEVIRVERIDSDEPGIKRDRRYQTVHRSRQCIAIDLKKAEGKAAVLRMIEDADGLIEGFRPGVMERLGLSPETCLERNPRLVFGRMTGWGQAGPLSSFAGHDINYIAISGLLSALGPKDGPPSIPLNIIADYAGGALYLCIGMLAAIMHSSRTGEGDVVDAAMIDGVTSLMTPLYGLLAAAMWNDERQSNFTDGGAPYYQVYETSDKRFIAVGPVEKKFYLQMLCALGVEQSSPLFEVHEKREAWKPSAEALQTLFKKKTRDEWVALLEESDACVSPVMQLREAPYHRQNSSRERFVVVDDVLQPAPAPRFMRHASQIRSAAPAKPEGKAILASFGFESEEIERLQRLGVVQ